jgi:hypothetical protein
MDMIPVIYVDAQFQGDWHKPCSQDSTFSKQHHVSGLILDSFKGAGNAILENIGTQYAL